MTVLLEINNLSISYTTDKGEVPAVDGVSFQLQAGQSLGLVGESGSGKTTIGTAIMGLLPANAKIKNGSIIFEGYNLLEAEPESIRQVRWKKIAMIFQAAMNALNPIMPVADQIAEAICIHEPGVDSKAAHQRVAGLFEQVGIPQRRLKDYPHQYSGGMRQRAVIAMALACNPRLIIADEPTTALDVIVQSQILNTITELQSRLNIGIILISHDISVTAEVCHYLGVMYAGQIVEIGTRDEILAQPVHPYTQALLEAHITLANDKVPKTVFGPAPHLEQVKSGCRFHARCNKSDPNCRHRQPSWHSLSETHKVLCWEADSNAG